MMGDTPPSFGAAKEIPTYIRDTSCNNIDRGSQSRPQDPAATLRPGFKNQQCTPGATYHVHCACGLHGRMNGRMSLGSITSQLWSPSGRADVDGTRSLEVHVRGYQHAPLQLQHHSIASSYRAIKSPNSKANNYNMRRTHCTNNVVVRVRVQAKVQCLL